MFLCIRAALGWFAFEPEWYDSDVKGLAQAEAQSVAAFVNQLTMERVESLNVEQGPKFRGQENGIVLANVMGQVV